ncbi:MAG TPA: hypothetical protein ENK57_24505, partial [Polyangiaceae bacterium]|nr:hypothetical protein [Polyangiaceae bacterium]
MSKHAVMFGLCLALTACGETPGATCTDDRECGAGRCQDGMCVGPPDGSTAPDASGRDGGAPLDAGGEACDSGALCAGRCCADGERCAYDMCVVDLGPCADHDDCRGDSYCDGDMRCTPYGVPPSVTHDPTCTRPIEVGDFTPDEQCRWEGPPSGDPYESWSSVYSTPMVVDFDFDSDRSVLAPSIVISSFGGPRGAGDGGILRVLNGRTCEEQYALTDPADRTIYASNNAVGDIDRAPDGRPEIIATSLFGYRQAGGLVAFKYYAEDSEFRRLWYGRRCDLPGEPRHMPNDWTSNNGPSIHDLDDDGVPEILYGRFVYSSEGCLLNPSAPYDNYERLGVYATVVDINNDGAPELVHHDGVYRWTGTDWMRTPDWAPADADAATRPGFVAVADLGDFPGTGADPSSFAEIVVASRGDGGGPGTVRVMTLRGDIVFGPYPLPSEPGRLAGRGGPPTIADFDGDGRREFAVAG